MQPATSRSCLTPIYNVIKVLYFNTPHTCQPSEWPSCGLSLSVLPPLGLHPYRALLGWPAQAARETEMEDARPPYRIGFEGHVVHRNGKAPQGHSSGEKQPHRSGSGYDKELETSLPQGHLMTYSRLVTLICRQLVLPIPTCNVKEVVRMCIGYIRLP